ncbi:MAG: (2Fe-2S)-binding protein [Xanthobacteraceae bacterium]|jgi:bacterioferritin-associated ferredoxin
MIVCSCNVISDEEVETAVSAAEPRTISQLYRELGHEPACGRCAPTIRDIMRADTKTHRRKKENNPCCRSENCKEASSSA